MEKFSSLKVKGPIEENNDEVLYSDSHISIIDYEDWSVIKCKDYAVCIPYLIESNQIILRYEYIPPFKYVDGQEYHLSLVGGGVEEGEEPNLAMTRELEEEAGIVLREDYEFEMLRPLFLSKSTSTKLYAYILPLNEKDYKEIVAVGDGTKHEAMSKSVKVDIKMLNSLITSDVITEYLLIKLKEYLNLQK